MRSPWDLQSTPTRIRAPLRSDESAESRSLDRKLFIELEFPKRRGNSSATGCDHHGTYSQRPHEFAHLSDLMSLQSRDHWTESCSLNWSSQSVAATPRRPDAITMGPTVNAHTNSRTSLWSALAETHLVTSRCANSCG